MSKININYTGASFCVYNSFVDNFIKSANPSYIKVYLYLLRHASSGTAVSLNLMSDDIGLIKSDIIDAFSYWDKQGLIAYNNDPDNIGIKLLNPDDAAAEKIKTESVIPGDEPRADDEKKLFQPGESVAASYKANVVVKAIHDDEKLAHLFSILQQMLNKNLSSNDYKIIYSFIDYLKLPESVIIILFEYCISMNKTNMRYIEKIAYAWADSNITTLEAAEEFIKQKNEQQSIRSYYKNKFKLNGRDFTDTEIKYLLSWVNDLKADEELIMKAFEKTVMNTGKLSFRYMDSIIRGESESQSGKNTGASSTFKNYPSKYEISQTEKARIEKMMAEYEGGDN